MNNKTVLVIDDEQSILDAMLRLVHKEDFTLLTALGGKEGLEILNDNQVELVIVDQNMPGMTGIEFLSIVKDLHADIVRIILTGQAELGIVIDAINKGEVYRYFNKPICKDEILTAIHQCLRHYDLAIENKELAQKTVEQNEELTLLNERLAQLVSSQSVSLDLSQEILERLPVAVIGITGNREIALTNNTAKKTIPALCQVMPGTDISEVLPGEILQVVDSSMSDSKSVDSVRFMWDRNVIRAMIEPLNDNGQSSGCIISFEIQEIA